MPDSQFRELLTESYRVVRATLPKRIQVELQGEGKAPARPKRARRR
jgi:predicted DNA-binding protein (MmcQ/YjbR family)